MSPTLEEVKTIAIKAGEILRAGYGQVHQIEMKGLTDPVTETDKRSEKYIVSYIREHYPEHSIVAEESGFHQGTVNSCWYIDPLDGTVNFSHGIPFFSVSIGYAEDGDLKLSAVYDPMRDELFYAEKGKGAWLNDRRIKVTEQRELIRCLSVTGFPYDQQSYEMQRGLELYKKFSLNAQACRRLGSAALDMCYVAAGRMDIYFEISVNSYDIAAGILLVQEAGGYITKFDGSTDLLLDPMSVIATSKEMHPTVLRMIQED
jgi:myo-inositol-1(or 4)-monophosphatase